MRILVVGGRGFLGKRFIRKWSQIHELIIFDREKPLEPAENDLSLIPIEKGTVEEEKIYEAVRKYKPEVVIHLAALSGLRKCEDNPYEAFKVNVFGTFNISKACLENDSKLVFISSREVYGETLNKESTENDSLRPNNVYGLTKMIGESIIKHESEKHGLDYTILRLTNVYGPEAGLRGANRIIETAIKEKKIRINGGNQLLNLVYVDDIIDLFMLVVSDKRSSKQIFNVGSEDTVTIKEFAEKVSRSLDGNIEFEYFPQIKFETISFRPSLMKLETVLGFRAKTDLKTGIEKTIDWYANNVN